MNVKTMPLPDMSIVTTELYMFVRGVVMGKVTSHVHHFPHSSIILITLKHSQK